MSAYSLGLSPDQAQYAVKESKAHRKVPQTLIDKMMAEI
jgi:hypothetical protein